MIEEQTGGECGTDVADGKLVPIPSSSPPDPQADDVRSSHSVCYPLTSDVAQIYKYALSFKIILSQSLYSLLQFVSDFEPLAEMVFRRTPRHSSRCTPWTLLSRSDKLKDMAVSRHKWNARL